MVVPSCSGRAGHVSITSDEAKQLYTAFAELDKCKAGKLSLKKRQFFNDIQGYRLQPENGNLAVKTRAFNNFAYSTPVILYLYLLITG